MATATPGPSVGLPPRDGGAAPTWPEQSFQDALQIIAEGLTELVGFGMTVISVRHGDDLVVVAAAGTEVARRPDGTETTPAQMLGTRRTVAQLETLLDASEDWGRFKFVSHREVPWSSWLWVREAATTAAGPDAWHPNDAVLAPIHDAHGTLVAAISADDPTTGRYPDAARRRVMDKYADAAAKVVVSALEREALERRLTLVQRARELVRTASRHLSTDALLDEVGPALLEALSATSLWVRVDGAGERVVMAEEHEPAARVPTEMLTAVVTHAARRLWEQRRAAVVYADGRTRHTVLHSSQLVAVRRVLTTAGYCSSLHAPIGAGEECLGSLILMRAAGGPDWSEAELELAAELGRDLGRIVSNGRAYAKAQTLVRRLRDLDAHKSHVIATISHELKNPLTVLLAHRDLLAPELAEDPDGSARLDDIDAHAQRMSGLVDNLLLLSKLADPDTPHVEQHVDLAALVEDVCRNRAATDPDGARLSSACPDPAHVTGDADELRALVANLVDNALKFSDADTPVEVEVTVAEEVVRLAVTDHGIGISEADRAQLFTDFFRSADPAARARPGSGLGLTIVDRILRRHGGHAEVRSEPGTGTTVRIHLPWSAPRPGPP